MIKKVGINAGMLCEYLYWHSIPVNWK